MNTVIQCAKLLVLLLLAAILVPVAYEIYHQRPAFESDVRRVSALLGRTEDAIKQVDKGATVWQQASQAQASESTAVLLATKNTLASIQADAQSVAASVNLLSSRTAQAIDHQDQSLLETQSQLRDSLVKMNAATEQLQATLTASETLLANPKIQESLASLAETSKQSAEAMSHLSAATADVQIVADKFREDFVKPKNRAWAYIKSVLDLGSKAKILF